MTLEPPDVIDTNLDLGPGETWLRPAPAALAGVAAILIKRGIAEARAPEVAMQLAKLAGRRFQDDLAIGQTPDRQASLWLLNALEHVEALLAVLQTGPKANSPNATTPDPANPGCKPAPCSLRRYTAEESSFGD